MITIIVFVVFCLLLITQTIALAYVGVMGANDDFSYRDASVRSRAMYHLRTFVFWPMLITTAFIVQIKNSGKGGWWRFWFMFFSWVVSCTFAAQMLHRPLNISYETILVYAGIASVVWYAIAYLIGFFVWDKTGKLIYDPSF